MIYIKDENTNSPTERYAFTADHFSFKIDDLEQGHTSKT